VTELSLSVFFGGKSKLFRLSLSLSLVFGEIRDIDTNLCCVCVWRITSNVDGSSSPESNPSGIRVCSLGTAAAAASKKIDALSPSETAIETTTAHTRECVYTCAV
jgi:hypothetical protein